MGTFQRETLSVGFTTILSYGVKQVRNRLDPKMVNLVHQASVLGFTNVEMNLRELRFPHMLEIDNLVFFVSCSGLIIRRR